MVHSFAAAFVDTSRLDRKTYLLKKLILTGNLSVLLDTAFVLTLTQTMKTFLIVLDFGEFLQF